MQLCYILGSLVIASPSQSIADMVAEDENLSTLATVLQRASLLDTLNTTGNLTVFAPTNDAFANLPNGVLSELLNPENKMQLYATLQTHVVDAFINAEDITNITNEVNTKSRERIKLTKIALGVIVQTSQSLATVTDANRFASNGVIHNIDNVLQIPPLPKIPQLAIGNNLSCLVEAVQKADLVDVLNGKGPFAVFTPTNDAFEKISASIWEPKNKATLKAILLTHVFDTIIKDEDIRDGVTPMLTKSSETINVTKSGNKVKLETSIGMAEVTVSNILASNGVVHIIDTVLMPATVPTIAQVAMENEQLSSLVTAVKNAGLLNTLNGTRKFTVFAPADAAFAKLPDEKLEELLKAKNVVQLYATILTHVVDKVIRPEDLQNNIPTEVTTASKKKIKVTNSGNEVIVEHAKIKAKVITSNILASNGIIHVIDAVLLIKTLPTIVQLAIATTNLGTLVKAVEAAALVDTLNGEGPFTVFAPTNDAFKKIPTDELKELLNPDNSDKLKSILLTHVLSNVITAEHIPQNITEINTINTEIIIVTNLADKGVMLETGKGNQPKSKANVITGSTNLLARNGIVHLIDGVLKPGRNIVVVAMIWLST